MNCKIQYLIPSGLDVLSRLLLGRGAAGKRKKRKRKEKVLKALLQNCFYLPNMLLTNIVISLEIYMYELPENMSLGCIRGAVIYVLADFVR